MRDRHAAPKWLERRIDPAVRDEVFEPAYHELLADHLAHQKSGRNPAARIAAEFLLWLRIRVIAVQSLRLQSLRDGSTHGGTGMTGYGRELRIAWRGLIRRPVFLVVAVLTLALGVGANAAIFSVVNGVLLEPLPFGSPDALVTLDARSTQGFPVSVSIPNQRDWHERNAVFEGLAMSSGYRMTKQSADGAEIVEPEIILGPFFELLGVAPLLGRWIRAEETARGAAPRAVLGYGYWQSAFGGRADVIGETMTLSGTAVEIVGVMPRGFGMPSPQVAMYMPTGMIEGLPWDDRVSSFGARAIARLRAGVSLASAQRDMDRVTQQVEAEDGRPGAHVEVRSLRAHFTGQARGPLLVLMGAVGFVLLIAGVNVANLLLVRGEGRRREMAMRLALGAGRGAVARQLLTESVLLCSLGGLCGLVMAYAVVGGLRAGLPLEPIVTERVSIDGTVLGFTSVLVLAIALLFGLLPAFRVTSSSPVRALREDSRGGESRGSHHVRSVLVTAELALALVLLIGAGLMLQSLGRLYDVETGYTPDDVLTARVSLPRGWAPDRAQWIAAYEQLIERVRAEPGAADVAATLLVPLASRSWELSVAPEGRPYSRTGGESVLYNIVSLDYFNALGVALVRGRWFEPTDRNGMPPVAIIDETMAARLWPNEDPIGKRIAFEEAEGSTDANPIPVYRTVVGVVPNIRHYDVRTPSRIQVYVSLQQTLERWGTSLSLAVRTTSSAPGFAPQLRAAVRAVSPDIALTDVRTLQDYMATDLGRDRALGGLLVGFGGLAAGLAAIGVFGVMSLLVTTQTREMGVRLALGARPGALLGTILSRTLMLAGLGILPGVAAAAVLSRLLGAFLFEVAPLQPGVYGAAAALLLAVAFLAALLPAVRAARVDPMTSLRQGA